MGSKGESGWRRGIVGGEQWAVLSVRMWVLVVGAGGCAWGICRFGSGGQQGAVPCAAALLHAWQWDGGGCCCWFVVSSPIVGSLGLRRGQVGVQTVWGHLEEDGVQVAAVQERCDAAWHGQCGESMSWTNSSTNAPTGLGLP